MRVLRGQQMAAANAGNIEHRKQAAAEATGIVPSEPGCDRGVCVKSSHEFDNLLRLFQS
jgi:hypothetical protein